MDHSKEARQQRWSRRKSRKTRDQKQGWVSGNPRYNGRNSDNGRPDRLRTFSQSE